MEYFRWHLTTSASGRTVVPSLSGAFTRALDSIWEISGYMHLIFSRLVAQQPWRYAALESKMRKIRTAVLGGGRNSRPSLKPDSNGIPSCEVARKAQTRVAVIDSTAYDILRGNL